MSVVLSINGTNYNYPSTSADIDWGSDATTAMQALVASVLYTGVTGQSVSEITITDPVIAGVSLSTNNINTTNKIVDNDAYTAQGDILIGSAASTPTVLPLGNDGDVLTADSGETTGIKWAAPAAGGGIQGISFYIAGNCYTGTGLGWVRVPKDFTISNVMISCGTAPTGATLIVDVNYVAYSADNAAITPTTIFTTGPGTNRPVIADGSYSDTSGAPDVTSIAAGGFITFDIDQVGSTVSGANLMVTIVAA